MRVLLTVATGVAVVVVVLGFLLTDGERRLAGSNYVHDNYDVMLSLGQGGHCEQEQLVPKDTAGVRLLIGTPDGHTPAMAVSIRAGGTRLSSGRLPPGARGVEPIEAPTRSHGVKPLHVEVPLQSVERTTPGATVCVGAPGPGGGATALYGRSGFVRFEWLREGRESWLELVPTLVHRFSLGKANPVGGLLLPLAALLLLIGWVFALRVLVRELRP